jgi:hypothetical protein
MARVSPDFPESHFDSDPTIRQKLQQKHRNCNDSRIQFRLQSKRQSIAADCEAYDRASKPDLSCVPVSLSGCPQDCKIRRSVSISIAGRCTVLRYG